jgi:hypothetical protein
MPRLFEMARRTPAASKDSEVVYRWSMVRNIQQNIAMGAKAVTFYVVDEDVVRVRK